MSYADPFANKRQHAREDVALRGQLLSPNRATDCAVLNIAMGGAKVRVDGSPMSDERLMLKIGNFGGFEGTVRWRSRHELGLQFDTETDISPEILMAMAMHRQ
jgi:hypothetical protein